MQPTGDTGLRRRLAVNNPPLIQSTNPHYPSPTFSSSLFPVTSLDSSEFLPPHLHHPQSQSSKAKDVHGKSLSTYEINILTQPTGSYPLSTSLTLSNAKQTPTYSSLGVNDKAGRPSLAYDTAEYSSSKAYDKTGYSHSPYDAALHSSSHKSSDAPPVYFLKGNSPRSSARESLAKSTSFFPVPNSSEPPTSTSKRPLEVSSVRFQCKGRNGYFGDQDFDCQVFHYCSHEGKRFTFRCGKGLTFSEVSEFVTSL